METEFKRGIHHNYLVIKAKQRIESYQIKMLTHNSIPGILPLEIRFIDGLEYYYYDISSRQPLSRIAEKQELSYCQLKSLFFALDRLLSNAKEYLLSEEHFILLPSFLYADVETLEICFIYFPEYYKPITESVAEFSEYLLGHIDHEEENAVQFAYRLYKITRNDCFVMGQILQLFEEEREEIKNAPEPVHLVEEQTVEENEEVGQMNIPPKKLKVKGGAIFVSAVVFLGSIAISGQITFLTYMQKLLIVGITATGFLFSVFLAVADKKQIEINGTKDNNMDDGEEERPKSEVRETCFSPADYNNLPAGGNTVFLGAQQCKEERILTGSLRGKEIRFELSRLPVTLGKLKKYADIVIADESVSRIHAAFLEEDKKICLQDLNSTNGTFKNGVILEANEIVAVEPGDEIRFGNCCFHYY